MGMEAIRLETVGAVQAKLPLKNIKSMNVPFTLARKMERATSTLNGILVIIQANILESLALDELRDALLPNSYQAKSMSLSLMLFGWMRYRALWQGAR